MNRLSPFALAVAIVATSVSVMASSPADTAVAHVRYGDLDLSSAAGRATLDGRINHAARTVCWIENANITGSEACRREAVASAHEQLHRTMTDRAAQLASR